MPIAGTWRAGRAGTTATDTDPYTGETLTEIPLADADDLDEAYATAKEAQREWAARLPGDRADVMRGGGSRREEYLTEIEARAALRTGSEPRPDVDRSAVERRGPRLRARADVLARYQAGLGPLVWFLRLGPVGLLLGPRWERPATTAPAALLVVAGPGALVVWWRRRVTWARHRPEASPDRPATCRRRDGPSAG